MLDFNLWGWNSRIFPGIDTLNVRLNDKVRIRVGNLTMTNHPIHVHGHEFTVTGTDGGPTPKTSRWPEVTTDIAVGQMRQIEFVADEEGDWAFHCHKSHHTMNAMGHAVPTLIGVDHRGVAKKINKLIPDYMVMGERGMADMTEMEMPIADDFSHECVDIAVDYGISGQYVTRLLDQAATFRGYPRELRSDPQQIAREVLVPTMDGAMVPLGQVARVEVAKGAPGIRTENALLRALKL